MGLPAGGEPVALEAAPPGGRLRPAPLPLCPRATEQHLAGDDGGAGAGRRRTEEVARYGSPTRQWDRERSRVMLVQRVNAKAKELLDPAGQAWRKAGSTTVVLSPTPLEMQPTEYVRVSWTGRPYGTASSVRVSTVHNGKEIFFRLQWDDDSPDGKIADINQFVDA